MTINEATVCQKYSIPVLQHRFDDNAEYKIRCLNKSFDKISRKYEYSASISKNGKCLYNLGLYDLEVVPEYMDFVQSKMDQLEKDILKRCLGNMLDAGGNKTSITRKIKELIDELQEKKPKRKTKAFQKPTIEEIQTYINEKGYTFDAEEFYNHYESNGWLVGKAPMKNWKSACFTWSKKDKQFNPNKKSENIAATYNLEEIEKKAIFNDDYQV